MRTTEGYSKFVHAGNGLFTLLGFMGLYTVLAILFLVLVNREIAHGPEPTTQTVSHAGDPLTMA
jgi:cytochrome d ubiquinol oxidase subunit I